jgi:hypothetical protein
MLPVWASGARWLPVEIWMAVAAWSLWSLVEFSMVPLLNKLVVAGVLLSDPAGELLRLLLDGRGGEEKVESWLGYEGEAGRGDIPFVVL